MATLTYVSNNPNPDPFETFFLPAPVVDPADATVIRVSRAGSMFGGDAVFDYLLLGGPATTIRSFTLAAPNAPGPFTVAQPFLTYDAGPAGITIATGLTGLYGSQANALAAAAQLLSGNDTITSTGPTGRLLLGYAGNDTITGGTGKDQISGGTGADQMNGGLDDDLYEVDNALDKVSEANVPGLDVVLTNVSWTLQAGSRVEEIQTSVANGNINLTGNEFANKLIGNNGANVLNGGGGADQMEGGLGNDTYFVDNLGDVVVEASVSGSVLDTVNTTVSFTVTDAIMVETLRAIGAGNVNLTGNSFVNTIFGNVGANVIDAGWGSDTIDAGAGNDTVMGGFGLDRILGGAGNDTLKGGFDDDYIDGGIGNDRLYGELQNDKLLGGLGNDILLGGSEQDTLFGGFGLDTMTGGTGRDTFVFNTALSLANVDRITDFKPVDDTVQLENAVFRGLAPGKLAAAAFHVSTSAILAHDPSDRVIYHKPTGALYFDSNGDAPGGNVKFAQLSPGLALTNADFFVI
jgi:Ca2+-binding RTX toxin-like protein